MADIQKQALEAHKQWKGKIEVVSTVDVKSEHDLSLAYTPGVAEPCKEIHRNKELVYDYCRKWNLVAVVTDGSAVLGLGDIGPEAGMPVMEGKCVLFKRFADVDAFPICLDTQDVDEIVRTVELLAPTFGGVNLEDIAAPRCFEIEKKLKEKLDIPIFHDDQHGTAVVTLAAMFNALKLTNKKLEDLSVVVNGAGAAGVAITKLLMSCGLKDVVLCDRRGAIYKGREGLNASKQEMAEITNLLNKRNPGRSHGGCRCVYWGIRTWTCNQGDGGKDEQGSHDLCHGKSCTRNLPRGCKGSRCKRDWYRSLRLPQSN